MDLHAAAAGDNDARRFAGAGAGGERAGCDSARGLARGGEGGGSGASGAPTVPHRMYQTPSEKRMITGFIENCWPKSHGSRMLPTQMWTRNGTVSAMTLW